MISKEIGENDAGNEQIDEEELELSDVQLERIDEIHNAVYTLCVVLSENEDLEWNMSYIGEIADLACQVLADQGHKVRYPAIVEEKDGSRHIEDYVPPRQNQATC